MVGMFLSSVEQSVVATALPTIAGELGSANQIAWVVSIYLLTSTIVTPLYGKMSDLFGRRVVYQTAIVVFLIGIFGLGEPFNATRLAGLLIITLGLVVMARA